MSIEGLVSFLMYTMLIVTPIMGSADTAMEMAESLGALQRILDLRAVTDQPMSTPTPSPSAHGTGPPSPACEVTSTSITSLSNIPRAAALANTRWVMSASAFLPAPG